MRLDAPKPATPPVTVTPLQPSRRSISTIAMCSARWILIGFGDEYAELLALAGEHEITALPNEVKAHACGAFFLKPTRCGTLAIKRTLSGVSQALREAPPRWDGCVPLGAAPRNTPARRQPCRALGIELERSLHAIHANSAPPARNAR